MRKLLLAVLLALLLTMGHTLTTLSRDGYTCWQTAILWGYDRVDSAGFYTWVDETRGTVCK